MVAFLFQVGKFGVQRSVPLIKQAVKQAVKKAPVIVRPGYEFGRAVITGGPKYVPLAGTQGGRTATIFVATRAGMQTRQIASYAVKTAVVKGPNATAKVILAAIRAPIRAYVITPIQPTLHVYQLYRAQRVMRGATSVIERAADAFIPRMGRVLSRFGLEPRLSGYITAPLITGGIYAAWQGIQGIERQRRRIDDYVSATIANYQEITSRVRVLTAPLHSRDVPVIVAPIRTPVVDTPTLLPNTPPITPPGRVNSRSGSPVIYTPPLRR